MAQLPVTVLTGYLGAGKTTLLNRVLTTPHGRRFAVIVNEFGEIGIDNDLIVSSEEEIFLTSNGCVCCSMRGDLIRIVKGLMKRAKTLDGILLETTGLADPAPIIQTFFMDDETRSRTSLDSVIAVVDAVNFPDQVRASREALEQVAFADLVILNKADTAGASLLDQAETLVREANPFAEIIRAERCNVPLDRILSRQAFDLGRLLDVVEPNLLDEEQRPPRHDHSVQSVCLRSYAPVDLTRFEAWIGELLAKRGQDILRSKGILCVAGSEQRLVFHGVHMMLETSWAAPWREGETRECRVVLIGRELDPLSLELGFRSAVAG